MWMRSLSVSYAIRRSRFLPVEDFVHPAALHLRAMNMLYVAIKERGSMVIVPPSAVETMGFAGMLATASVGGIKPV